MTSAPKTIKLVTIRFTQILNLEDKTLSWRADIPEASMSVEGGSVLHCMCVLADVLPTLRQELPTLSGRN